MYFLCKSCMDFVAFSNRALECQIKNLDSQLKMVSGVFLCKIENLQFQLKYATEFLEKKQ